MSNSLDDDVGSEQGARLLAKLLAGESFDLRTSDLHGVLPREGYLLDRIAKRRRYTIEYHPALDLIRVTAPEQPA